MESTERRPGQVSDSPALPGAGIAEVIARHVDSLRHHHAAASTGEDAVEAIHKTRVTTRRLQAALDLLQSGSNSPDVRELKGRLRDLREGLAGLRNYDVFLCLVDHALLTSKSLEPDIDMEALKRYLEERRGAAFSEAKQALKKFKIGFLLPLLTADQADESARLRATGLDLSAIDHQKMNQRAARRLRERVDEFSRLTGRLVDASDSDDIHRLRMAAKQLRYLLETFAELGYGESRGLLRWLRSLQGRLGDWHDLEALEQEIVSLVRRKNFVKGRLLESACLLRATAKVVQGKETRARRTVPVKKPVFFDTTVARLLARLR